MRFRFEASDPAGQIERGELDADSERQARQSLRQRGLIPLNLRRIDELAAPSRQHARGESLGDDDLAAITRQLAGLVGAGIAVERALATVAEQADQARVARVVLALRTDVLEGLPLGRALARQPRSFPKLYVALVAAGEETGDLGEVFEALAEHIENRGVLRGKLLAAFLYPALVGLVSILIVGFLLAYVVPEVVSAFAQTQQSLPWLTQVMLQISRAVRDHGLLAVAVTAALWLLWRLSLRHPLWRGRWHALRLKIPLWGRFELGLQTARFASTLAILVRSSVPMLRALQTATQTVSNERLQEELEGLIREVREGGTLTSAMARLRRFPPLLVQLAASGERTGRLAEMLHRGSQAQARELERKALTIATLLEPLMILLMGGFVLLIVLAVLMPIIELNQLVM